MEALDFSPHQLPNYLSRFLHIPKNSTIALQPNTPQNSKEACLPQHSSPKKADSKTTFPPTKNTHPPNNPPKKNCHLKGNLRAGIPTGTPNDSDP